MAERIEILMATYNGSRHLEEQLDSIMTQTYSNFHLMIGDDASTDNTLSILEAYKKKYPEKITLFPFHDNVGILKNFSRLMELSEAPYLMFADQDDFWFPTKIEITFNKMKEMEQKWGKEIPLLVHTDMEVIDELGKSIAPSHWKRQGLNPHRSGKLNAVLMQNGSWGCTMLFNRTLCNLATPIPAEGFVHDYWVALVAAGTGQIDFLDAVTMRYRQHLQQYVGSQNLNMQWFFSSVWGNPKFQQKIEFRIMQCMVRGYVFYRLYQNALPEESKATMESFLALKNMSKWKELWTRIKYGFFPHGFWPSLALTLGTLKMDKRIDQEMSNRR